MQAIGAKRVTSRPSKYSGDKTLANAKASNLSFYRDYPKDAIGLDDFEQYAIDRLQGNVF
jgi:hypothetical protein